MATETPYTDFYKKLAELEEWCAKNGINAWLGDLELIADKVYSLATDIEGYDPLVEEFMETRLKENSGDPNYPCVFKDNDGNTLPCTACKVCWREMKYRKRFNIKCDWHHWYWCPVEVAWRCSRCNMVKCQAEEPSPSEKD